MFLFFSTQQEITNIATAFKRKLPKGLFIFPFDMEKNPVTPTYDASFNLHTRVHRKKKNTT